MANPAGRGLLLTEWLKQLLQFLAAAMLLAIVLIVLSNVVCRYFLHIGLGWTEEAARFLLIAMTFVAAAAAVKEWGHFQLLVITKWMSPRLHRVVQAFAVLVVLVMSVILVRYGIAITKVSWFQTSPTMEWSMGYLYAVVPLSGAIMFVFALEHLVNIFRGTPLPAHGMTDDAHLTPPTGNGAEGAGPWL
jgi:TRAP-type C4-dicarboxylate transport system permease small subunit